MKVAIYGPGDRRVLVSGEEGQVRSTVPLYEGQGREVRVLDGTDLADIELSADPRLPATAEEFDERYPSA